MHLGLFVLTRGMYTTIVNVQARMPSKTNQIRLSIILTVTEQLLKGSGADVLSSWKKKKNSEKPQRGFIERNLMR